MSLRYENYLQLEKVLNAQKPLTEGEHDETLFIIIHQTYELWFKQLIHECQFLNKSFGANNLHGIQHTLKRMLTILKTIVYQVDILETMTPLSFASFRKRLENASGFQSHQFRWLEFYMGHKDNRKIDTYEKESLSYQSLASIFQEPTLYDHFLQFLHQYYCIQIPKDILNRDVTQPYTGDSRMEKILLTIYQEKSLLSIICERLIDWDEGLQEWRYRHVKMVERTIGNRQGTGGSSGVEYLQKSLFKPSFPDLWKVRNYF